MKFEKLKLVKKHVFIKLANLQDKNHFLRKIYLENLKSFRKLKKYSKTRVVRRCIVENRGRSVSRLFNVSRIYLRKTLQFGLISGYKKSV